MRLLARSAWLKNPAAQSPCRHCLARQYSESALSDRAAKETPEGQPATSSATKVRRFRHDVKWTGPLPDLSVLDPILDHPPEMYAPSSGPDHKAYYLLNEEPNRLYQPETPDASDLLDDNVEEDSTAYLSDVTSLTTSQINALFKYPLSVHRVVNMTRKGKIQSMYALVCVGNGNGLLGIGQGKDESVPGAIRKATNVAIKSMNLIDRFEDRTLFSNVEHKFGACRIVLRPRPEGFGLRVHHGIHQMAKACGLKDLSAKVFGSRNPMQVSKCAFQALSYGQRTDLDLVKLRNRSYLER